MSSTKQETSTLLYCVSFLRSELHARQDHTFMSCAVRTYRDIESVVGVVLVPDVGMDNLTAGEYLIHTENDGHVCADSERRSRQAMPRLPVHSRGINDLRVSEHVHVLSHCCLPRSMQATRTAWAWSSRQISATPQSSMGPTATHSRSPSFWTSRRGPWTLRVTPLEPMWSGIVAFVLSDRAVQFCFAHRLSRMFAVPHA